jgi:hypothetical protein
MPALKTLRRHVSAATAGVPVLRTIYQWQRSTVEPRIRAAVRDLENRARYGSDAPLFAERLWLDPLSVDHFKRSGSAADSARVLTGAWPRSDEWPVADDPVLGAAIARWTLGLPWEETGEIERMERAIRKKGPLKGCVTRADILRRCAALDEIFRAMQREARLRTRTEVEPGAFREFGGIGMHIGPGGRPVRGWNGRHRFAMARILRLPLIPVRIGLVHVSALPALPRLRNAARTVVEEPC